MALPRPTAPTTLTREVGGTMVTVRCLTREEASSEAFLSMAQAVEAGDVSLVPALERYLLACGLDEPLEAIEEWWPDQPADFVAEVVAMVAEVSGLTKGYERQPNPRTAGP